MPPLASPLAESPWSASSEEERTYAPVSHSNGHSPRSSDGTRSSPSLGRPSNTGEEPRSHEAVPYEPDLSAYFRLENLDQPPASLPPLEVALVPATAPPASSPPDSITDAACVHHRAPSAHSIDLEPSPSPSPSPSPPPLLTSSYNHRSSSAAVHKPPFPLADVVVPPNDSSPSHSSSSGVTTPMLIERRVLFASSNSRIRFVPSYQQATVACMTQSQLLKRDPKLIGRLLQYFIATFLLKYWRSTLLVLTVIFSIEWFQHRWLFQWLPAALLAFVVCKVAVMRARLTVELTAGVPVSRFQFYKYSRLLQRGKGMAVARLYASNGVVTTPSTPSTPGHPHHAPHTDIFFQPSEGYCGQASLNNLLASIPLPHPCQPGATMTRRFFVVLPSIVRPFSLTDMEKYIREVIAASNVLASHIEKVEAISEWGDAADADARAGTCDLSKDRGYENFLQTLGSQLNDPRYRFMANFLRSPLFFCQLDRSPHTGGSHDSPRTRALASAAQTPTVSLGRKLFSGHWSPLISFLDAAEVDRVMFRGSSTPQQSSNIYAFPPSPATLVKRQSSFTRAATPTVTSPFFTHQPTPTPMLASIPSDRILDEPLELDAESTSDSSASSTHSAVGDGKDSIPTLPPSELFVARSRSGSVGGPAPSPSHATSASLFASTPKPMARSTSDAALHYANYLSATGSASVAAHPTERATLQDGLILVADVNPAYGHFLVPPRRLYQALRTVNLVDGAPRGLIRITLKQTHSHDALDNSQRALLDRSLELPALGLFRLARCGILASQIFGAYLFNLQHVDDCGRASAIAHRTAGLARQNCSPSQCFQYAHLNSSGHINM